MVFQLIKIYDKYYWATLDSINLVMIKEGDGNPENLLILKKKSRGNLYTIHYTHNIQFIKYDLVHSILE